MWEQFLRATEADPILGFGSFIGAVIAVVWLGRMLLLRFAPKWMVGPGGFLLDTRGRLGLLQMQDRGLEQWRNAHDSTRHGSGDPPSDAGCN
jgi:hypothetical protein